MRRTAAAGSRSRRWRSRPRAAVAAAVVVPMIWERGTLIATAMTPVIVALVSEGLRKPAEKITAVTPLGTRRSATGAAVRDPEFDPLPPGEGDVAVSDDDPFGLRGRAPVKHHWKIALATGAAAFAIAVVGLTMSELVFGGPATKDGGSTTFFSGSSEETPTPTATPTATETPEATETAEPTRHADADADAHGDARAARGDADAYRYPLMAKDRIPTSRVARTARVSGLAAGPGGAPPRHPRRQPRPLRRGQAGRARAPQPRGGRADRRGAGDDEGRGDEARPGHELPRRRARARGAPRGVPAQARRAARRRAEGALLRHAQGHRVRARRADRRGLRRRSRASRSRPPRSARSTARGCTTAATWRSRSSTRASRRPCGPTCRTWG